MNATLIAIFIYFWTNAIYAGIIAAETVHGKNCTKTAVRSFLAALFFGVPIIIIFLFKLSKNEK